jgi:ribonuclease T1
MDMNILRATWFKKWLLLLSTLFLASSVLAKGALLPGEIAVADLPAEARYTLRLIKEGGPFPYPKDGSVFGNYERVLPRQPRGYYREYTVKTPRVKHRGARRIVSGGKPAVSGEYYYTSDHYTTFQRIRQTGE